MREIIARLVCVLTFAVVVGLSLRFASAHNPRPASSAEQQVAASPGSPPAVQPQPAASVPAPTPPDIGAMVAPGTPSPEVIERGRFVYREQNCSGCHSLHGEGNPRYPLDGVGSKLSRAELEEWITGTGKAAAELSGGIIRRKTRFRDLPPEDMNALIAYLEAER